MQKFCDNVHCTYRYCKHHVRNKISTEEVYYTIEELAYTSVCKLRPLTKVKPTRDKEQAKLKHER